MEPGQVIRKLTTDPHPFPDTASAIEFSRLRTDDEVVDFRRDMPQNWTKRAHELRACSIAELEKLERQESRQLLQRC